MMDLDQYLCPEPLTNLCYKQIAENLDIISVKDKRGRRTLRKGLAFPSEICHKLIEYSLRNNDSLEFDDCFFSIFKNCAATGLKSVKLVRRNLTDHSVEILTSHKLIDLELTKCNRLTEDSIEHINANSENLHNLVIHRSMALPIGHCHETGMLFHKRGYVFKAPNLRRLVLSGYREILASKYPLVLAGLTNLTHLDLSNNIDVGSLEFCTSLPNLISLVLYNVNVSEGNADKQCFVNNICHLKNLRHLDLSQSNLKYGHFENPNKILTEIVTGLPKLVSLDISGTNLAGRGVAERPIGDFSEFTQSQLCDIPGLASRVNNPLQFLGLYGTAHGACKRHDIPAKVIAGDANEDQILIAAHACMDNKQELLDKVLNELYNIFRYENCHKTDEALCTVLEAMEKYPEQKHIQICCSATLFYIVKMREKGELVAGMTKRIISTLLAGMSAHIEEETIMRNGCLTLCQFRIPQDVMSNYETLVKVLLLSAKHKKPESLAQRIVIYLLNSLASQVESREKCLLGKLGCVKIMLELVEYRVERGICDDVLEIAWSTMWNMTDEVAINCEHFLDEKGMVFFLRCVRQYPHKDELLRNMVGLLGNVAEVEYLRVRLMRHRYVTVFANLLLVDSDGIEVSYNAAGILAHMVSDGIEAWTVEKPTRAEVLALMVHAIKWWDLYAERNINYRSFLPLLRLLDIYHTPECQHWAVWALANLTSVYPNKYCILVVKEGGLEKLNAAILDPRPYARIKELAHIVIDNCCLYSKQSITNIAQPSVNAECNVDG